LDVELHEFEDAPHYVLFVRVAAGVI
jgi:hypothetical protein